MKRVLLIEDEPGLVMTLTDRLKSEGYEVGTASDGPAGLERAVREPWDVILLDIMLPGMNGFDVCRDARQKGVTTPIIMLTARGQVVDRVRGLKLGADDYLTKPFDLLELSARIEVQLRRAALASAPLSATQYRFGNISVDFRKVELLRDGKPVELSAREFLLLKCASSSIAKPRSADGTNSSTRCGDTTPMPSTRTVGDAAIAWLRQENREPSPKQPQYVLTVHGLGYKFVG